jgi:predicted Zn-dependent peptidase
MALIFPEIKYYSINETFKLMFLKLPSNIFSCNMTVDVGSVDEDHEKEEMGLAHFFEHMILKGKVNDESITQQLDFLGTQYNASTSYYKTNYYINGDKKDYSFILEIMLQLMFEPQFPQEDIDNEINVVIEEFHMGKDNHGRNFILETMKIMYEGIDEKLTIPVIGYEECIVNFTRDKLVKFYNDKYESKLKILTIIGDIDEKNIMKIIKKRHPKVEPWTHTFKPLNRELTIPHYKNIPTKIHYMSLPVSQCMVNICFRSIDDFSSWALVSSLISSVLCNGTSSRLFNLLRIKLGVTYYQNAFSMMYEGHSLYIINFGTRSETVAKAIKHVLIELLTFPDVTDCELQKAKNMFETSILYNTETPSNIGGSILDYVMAEKDPELFKNIRSRINNIKAKHINGFAKKIFRKENMCILVGGENINQVQVNNVLNE